MRGEDIKTEELGSPQYADVSGRYVVSLIVTYSEAEVVNVYQALRAAVDLIREECSPSTVWTVHDRVTGETYEIEQGQVDTKDVPYIDDAKGWEEFQREHDVPPETA